MAFELPELPYAYDALQPYIDEKTMQIHHDKHHAGYTNNLNKALEGTDLEGLSIEEVLQKGSVIPAVRNNGGGYYNHKLFWEIMSPHGGGEPIGSLEKAIDDQFGSFDNFKSEFGKAAATRFGSGWAWLIKKDDGKLMVCSTPNQDNLLMPDVGCSGKAILCLDVWEHAYYLHYQNRRQDYIDSFFNVINWHKVAELYEN